MRLIARCEPRDSASGWAPLWAYVVTIIPIVSVTQQTLGDGATWWERIAVATAIVVANVTVITALYRLRRSSGSEC